MISPLPPRRRKYVLLSSPLKSSNDSRFGATFVEYCRRTSARTVRAPRSAFDFDEYISLVPMIWLFAARRLKYQSPFDASFTSKLRLSLPFSRTDDTPPSADARRV